MKRLICIASFGLLLFITALPVAGQANFRQGQEVNLAKTETINKNYYAAGSTVSVSGVVNGDAYVAGGNIIIDGTINGDLLAAGGNVTIAGTITHDLRVGGGNVTIAGTVLGNITAVGGSVALPKNATTSGTITAAGGSVRIATPELKDVTVAGGSVSLDSQVTGDVNAATDNLVLSPSAKISGSLTYISSKAATVPQGVVAGSVTHKLPHQELKNQVNRERVWGTLGAFGFITKLMGAFSMVIIGIILLVTMPVYTKKTAALIGERPWASLGIGFLSLLLFPVTTLLLFMTIIGIPLGGLLIAAFIMLMLLSKVFVILYVGQRLFSFFDKTAHAVVIFLVGVVIYELITMLPIIGALVWFIVTLLGLGAVLIQEKRFYTALRARQEI